MNWLSWQPELSALALLDAYREGNYEHVRNVMDNTPEIEVHWGLVRLCSALLLSFASNNGMTQDEAVALFRRGIYASAIQ